MNALAGTLRERVTVWRRAAARDALGGAAGGWDAVSMMAAAVVPDARGGAVAGDAVAGLSLWRVTVRSPCDVAPGDRLEWRGRRLAVRRVAADPRAPDRIEIFGEEER